MDSVAAHLEWFKTTILPHEPALRARLRRMLPRNHDIDDLASETLTRAYATPEWQAITAGRAYLFQTARNLLIDAARRDKVVSFDLVADLDLLQIDDSVEPQLQARDELRHLQAIIETLPIQCRRVFVLRRVYEHSVQEIAEEMGLSVSTVEKHLTKAVMRVMRAVAEREEAYLGRTVAATPERAAADRRGSGATRR